jgi:hypothetical protein
VRGGASLGMTVFGVNRRGDAAGIDLACPP